MKGNQNMRINFRKIGVGLFATILTPLMLASGVFAWGPENRPSYKMNAPADHAVFNSITDNPAVGNEFDFVRVAEKGTGDEYVSDLEIEAGKQYEVYIYYHNDASETYNDRDHNYVGAARETRLSSSFPEKLAKGEKGTITGRITSTTTNPTAVWDEAYITAKQPVTLHYVEGSAKIYNKWPTNGSVLSTQLFSSEGTYIGLNKLDGLIPGCDRFSGSVVYTIQAVIDGTEDKPVTPDPTPEQPGQPEKPEIPAELPTTGPLEIILAVVVIAMILAGILYWNKTRKTVKKVSKRAKGRK